MQAPTRASRFGEVVGASKQQASEPLHVTEMPQHLLELIMIPGTSVKDKKALRQTCK